MQSDREGHLVRGGLSVPEELGLLDAGGRRFKAYRCYIEPRLSTSGSRHAHAWDINST
ncbi:MAG: hypothetical protein ACUVS3_12730 [Thermodesulfobacteriota bacterium]